MGRVLVACESSGAVREAFRALGHDAWSCDLLPADDGSPFHWQADARELLTPSRAGNLWRGAWDLLIAHPPCTYLCSSGMHWTTRGLRDPRLTEEALDLVRFFLAAPVPRIAVENPVGCISTRIRKADQYIQPYEYGHPESKRTGLWLVNLPLLVPTHRLPLPASGRWANQTPSGQNKLGPSADRWKARSATYKGVAEAMAAQWGRLIPCFQASGPANLGRGPEA